MCFLAWCCGAPTVLRGFLQVSGEGVEGVYDELGQSGRPATADPCRLGCEQRTGSRGDGHGGTDVPQRVDAEPLRDDRDRLLLGVHTDVVVRRVQSGFLLGHDQQLEDARPLVPGLGAGVVEPVEDGSSIGGERWFGGGPRAERPVDPVAAAPYRVEGSGLLVREVAAEGAPVDVGRLRDLLDRHMAHPPFEHQLERGLRQRVPSPARLPAAPFGNVSCPVHRCSVHPEVSQWDTCLTGTLQGRSRLTHGPCRGARRFRKRGAPRAPLRDRGDRQALPAPGSACPATTRPVRCP